MGWGWGGCWGWQGEPDFCTAAACAALMVAPCATIVPKCMPRLFASCMLQWGRCAVLQCCLKHTARHASNWTHCTAANDPAAHTTAMLDAL
jgi:hypothetical protein